MTKQTIYTSKAPDPIGAYSQGVILSNTLFLSGQIGLNPNTMELRDTFSAQVKQIFSNLLVITDEAGTTLDEIVKLTVFVTNLENFPILNDIMTEVFKTPYPARSVVEVSNLPMGTMVEIEAVVKV
tara:strand:- start:150 stop:527 length:378 start_codon:yes stop_codon:yes gene_type:complete